MERMCVSSCAHFSASISVDNYNSKKIHFILQNFRNTTSITQLVLTVDICLLKVLLIYILIFHQRLASLAFRIDKF